MANVTASTRQAGHVALTDPDSNEVVPAAPRFAGDFMLTSQGDLEQNYGRDAAAGTPTSVLMLTQSVDDTAGHSATGGRLFATDSPGATAVVTGPSTASRRSWLTPLRGPKRPGICPVPHYPANYLATPTRGRARSGR